MTTSPLGSTTRFNEADVSNKELALHLDAPDIASPLAAFAALNTPVAAPNDDVEAAKALVHWPDELRQQLQLAFPLVCTFILEYIPGMVSIALVGHMPHGDAKLFVDAATMSTMVANITCVSVCFGLTSALDTLCSQAYGAKNLAKIGIYLQAGCLVIVVCLIPILLLNWFTEDLLRLVGQNVDVARLAGQYTRISFFGMPFMILYEMLRKCLQAQNVVRPMVVIAIIGNIVNAGGGYVLTYHTSLGFKGAALGRALGYTILPFCLLGYVLCWSNHDYHAWWSGWNFRLAQREVMAFLRLGIPGLLMMVMEWWAYEMMALMSGWLPNSVLSMSTHTVMITLASVIFVGYTGLSAAASIRLGNALGANRPAQARMITRISLLLGLVVASIVAVLVLLLRYQLPKLLVNDAEAIHNAGKFLIILAPFTIIDATNCMLQGICRGVGRQRVAAWVNAFGYYVLGMPVCAVFAFVLHWGITGLWLGCCIVGTGTAMTILIWYVYHVVNWDELAQDAAVRTATI